MKRFVQALFILLVILFFGSIFIGIGGLIALVNPQDERVDKASILALDLDGVIMDNKDFLELLCKYRKEDRIKGVLIRINSPGGVVGPSQEMYEELKRTRIEFKKPVIAFCGAVAASDTVGVPIEFLAQQIVDAVAADREDIVTVRQ